MERSRVWLLQISKCFFVLFFLTFGTEPKCCTFTNHPVHNVRTSVLHVWAPPTLLFPCLSILRGVNSRGVGVGGSTMVHGYRMCLSGYAAWLPSVRMSHSALLSHFLLLPLPFSLSLSLSLFSAHLLTFSHPLILYLPFAVVILSHLLHAWSPLQLERVISSLKSPTLESKTCKNTWQGFILLMFCIQIICNEWKLWPQHCCQHNNIITSHFLLFFHK